MGIWTLLVPYKVKLLTCTRIKSIADFFRKPWHIVPAEQVILLQYFFQNISVTNASWYPTVVINIPTNSSWKVGTEWGMQGKGQLVFTSWEQIRNWKGGLSCKSKWPWGWSDSTWLIRSLWECHEFVPVALSSKFWPWRRVPTKSLHPATSFSFKPHPLMFNAAFFFYFYVFSHNQLQCRHTTAARRYLWVKPAWSFTSVIILETVDVVQGLGFYYSDTNNHPLEVSSPLDSNLHPSVLFLWSIEKPYSCLVFLHWIAMQVGYGARHIHSNENMVRGKPLTQI